MSGKTGETQSPTAVIWRVKASGYYDAQGRFHMLRCIGRIFPAKGIRADAITVKRRAS